MLTVPEDLCIDCGNAKLIKDAKETEVFKHLFGTRHLPLICVEPLVRYLKPMPDADAEFRRLYLHSILLGRLKVWQPLAACDPHNPFLAMQIQWPPYSSEDVVDLVLEFVCG